MGELREGIEGYEPPQYSNMLVDDINFIVTKKQNGDWTDFTSILGYFTHFYTDSHHIIDEGEERLRLRLSWKGEEAQRIETLIKKIDGVLKNK